MCERRSIFIFYFQSSWASTDFEYRNRRRYYIIII